MRLNNAYSLFPKTAIQSKFAGDPKEVLDYKAEGGDDKIIRDHQAQIRQEAADALRAERDNEEDK